MAAPSAASGVSASLTRKLGPLPVWAWLILGAVVGWYVYEHYFKGSSSSTAATTANPVTPFDAAPPAGGIGTATTPPGDPTGTTPPSAVSPSPGPDPAVVNPAPDPGQVVSWGNGPQSIATTTSALSDYTSPVYTSPQVPNSNQVGVIKGPGKAVAI